jgi:hypothetical protein
MKINPLIIILIIRFILLFSIFFKEDFRQFIKFQSNEFIMILLYGIKISIYLSIIKYQALLVYQ